MNANRLIVTNETLQKYKFFQTDLVRKLADSFSIGSAHVETISFLFSVPGNIIFRFFLFHFYRVLANKSFILLWFTIFTWTLKWIKSPENLVKNFRVYWLAKVESKYYNTGLIEEVVLNGLLTVTDLQRKSCSLEFLVINDDLFSQNSKTLLSRVSVKEIVSWITE